MDYEQLMANRLKSALHKQEMRGNLLTKSTSIYCLILIILNHFMEWMYRKVKDFKICLGTFDLDKKLSMPFIQWLNAHLF